ncbi:hypothetical protein [Rhodococcus sp. NPDC047139]|uniref:hypothetical protein n=1 Tax=Rhodococcus sp. NPDC047139 TaxID=3155141 RepID=UPI0033EB178A
MAALQQDTFDIAPPSSRRILAIIALTGMLTIGFLAAVFTASYLIGGTFAVLTGACIVLAHLMIAPAGIIHDDLAEYSFTPPVAPIARPEVRRRWNILESRF